MIQAGKPTKSFAAPALLLALLLAGGAEAIPSDLATYKPVPAKRIFSAPSQPPDSSSATLIVLRKPAIFIGTIAPSVVVVDGTAIADVRNGEAMALRLTPGEHRLKVGFVSYKPKLIIFVVDVEAYSEEISVQFEPGRTRTFELVADFRGDWSLKLLPE
ncbi:MAG: hypothetical protein HY859_12405 [Caulobacterales bacterium]|nr:hypothetical protein [Caulobacterales bacterium]